MELLGFLLPPVIDRITKDVHNDTERYILALLSCIVLASIVDWNAVSHTDLTSLLSTIGIISAESQLMFKLYWQNSFVRTKYQKVIGTTNSTLQG